MGFSIKFADSHGTRSDNHATGKIVIDKFEEYFQSSLTYWNTQDYENHWKEALNLIIREATKSCLITNMFNPDFANYIIWWPMYRVGECVFIQNQILFLDKLQEHFQVTNPFIHIADRLTENEDGEKISEWVVNIRDIDAFLSKLQ